MSMPKLKYFIQCDEVQQKDGKYCPMGLFDTIYSLVFPTQHNKFSLMLGFVNAAPGTYDIEIHISAPNKEVFGEVKGTFVSESADQTINTVFNIEKMPLPMAGEYMFSVFVQGDLLCEYAFRAMPPMKRQENLSAEDLHKLKADPNIIQSANAEVECPKCHQRHKFQLHLDPTALPEKGFMPFPPGNIFKCICSNTINLESARMSLSNLVGLPKDVLEKLNPKKNIKGQ